MIVKVRIKKKHQKLAGTHGVMDRIDQLNGLTSDEFMAATVCAALNKQYETTLFSPEEYQVIEQNGEIVVFPKEN